MPTNETAVTVSHVKISNFTGYRLDTTHELRVILTLQDGKKRNVDFTKNEKQNLGSSVKAKSALLELYNTSSKRPIPNYATKTISPIVLDKEYSFELEGTGISPMQSGDIGFS